MRWTGGAAENCIGCAHWFDCENRLANEDRLSPNVALQRSATHELPTIDSTSNELNTIPLTSLLLQLLQLVRWLGHATVTPTNQSDTTSLYGIYRSC